jgi:hypothetical protein
MDLTPWSHLKGRRAWVTRPATGMRWGEIIDVMPSLLHAGEVDLLVRLDGGTNTTVRASEQSDRWDLVA